MVLNLVVEGAIALRIGPGHAVDLRGGSVREDDVGADDENAALAERHLAVIAPKQLDASRAESDYVASYPAALK